HEYGHHITRHTADLMANTLRPAERQHNRKTALDEGVCDYWAAAMLSTPHIWCWHQRHDDEQIHPPSLSTASRMADFDRRPTADPHANGTIWGTALWDMRRALSAEMGGAEAHAGETAADRLVLQWLLLLGQRPGGGASRSAVRAF